MNPKILLIHPPLVKPSEPPAGIVKLSECLTAHGVYHDILDANLEGILSLTATTVKTQQPVGRWDARACRNQDVNLAALRDPKTYRSFSRYARAVSDFNHILQLAGKSCGVHLSLSDYVDKRLWPLKTDDLFEAASHPGRNPFYPYFSKRIGDALSQNPEYIGFSLNFLSQAICAMAMIGFIKQCHPRQKIILGGSLTTSWMALAGGKNLFAGLVDHLVAGPGEKTLLELLRAGENKDGFSCTGLRPLDRLSYLSPGRIEPYSAASGCWWRRCSFCPETAEANPYLPQPAGQVIHDLHRLTRSVSPALFHLLDSAIAPSLLSALIVNPPGVAWYGFARVTPHLADEDFCRQLKAGGCVMLKLGLESGDQTVLDRLHKGIDLQVASKALRSLKKSGISVYGYFLFGTPPEDEDAAKRTLDFVCRHAGSLSFLNLSLFNLPVNSPEARTLDTEDFSDGDLSLYQNFRHPACWNRPRVREFLEKKFKKHPLIQPIVRRNPPFFTSNHAPFFNL